MFKFELLQNSRDTKGRLGVITTSHNSFETPVFMPVGTQGSVKTLSPDEIEEIGASIILGNAYHLFIRPGHELIRDLGGLHKFMNWKGSILTDSGGFQIFSLSDLRLKFDENGVEFQSHIDGGIKHFLTPELSIEVQEALGSDIMMVLDECTPYPATEEQAKKSMELSLKWAARSLNARKSDNALFGIVQGGTYKHLREEYIDRLLETSKRFTDFNGYSIGGLSVGEPTDLMYEMTAICTEKLPADKPRYLMGVGTPENILESIDLGIDMFDCVMPTRNARHGKLFTKQGDINITNAKFIRDMNPIEEDCGCFTCKNFTKAYLKHLFQAGEILALRLASIHNLQFYIDLIEGAKLALKNDNYPEFKRDFISKRKGRKC
ncbi:MAG: tRNA guanosine(34) transglycosylase Tgt [Pseudomonadota bacterium]